MMAKATPLKLQIKHEGEVSSRYLRVQDKFTIGRAPDNDLTLIGQEYPHRHVLVSRENNTFQLYLLQTTTGEVWIENSCLTFQDLIKHRLLPRKGKAFVLPLTEGKQGYVNLGQNTRIDFAFDGTYQPLPDFAGFSWFRATIKEFYKDLYFKLIFLFFLLFHGLLVFKFKDVTITISKPITLERVPERFAKFIPKAPEEPVAMNLKSTIVGEGEEGPASNEKQKKTSSEAGKERGRGGGKGNPITSQGLLGLIAGQGATSQSSSVMDFLVDRGLVAELNNVLGGGSNLKAGKRKESDENALDQLIGTGGTGGIDNLIADLEEVETVTLKKKAQVKLVEVGSKTGSSAEALGNRTNESIMNVVMSHQGRITYIYEKYLKRNPEFRGKLSIRITIAANGQVTSCSIVESTMNHPEFESEILNVFRRLKFPEIPEGSVSVTFPLVFQRMD